MKSTLNPQAVDRPSAKSEPSAPASHKQVRRFESLFQDPAALAQQVSGQWQSPLLNHTAGQPEGTHQSDVADARRLMMPTVDQPPDIPHIESAQTLAVRATTGPMAGLLIQAEWRQDALKIRLSTPGGDSGQRLMQHRASLASVLSEALGVTVTIEVDQHADA